MEIIEALRWQAVLLTEKGEREEAIAFLQAAWQGAQMHDQKTVEWNALLELTRLAAAQGDQDTLPQLVQRLRKLWQSWR